VLPVASACCDVVSVCEALRNPARVGIRDFERSLAGSHSAQGLVDEMMALYGDLGNLYTLWTAAQAVFEQGQGASS
jgi:exonuclease III